MVKIDIPHNLNPVCCMVSGIDDQYFWKTGFKLPTYYLFWASGMCSFVYLKYRKASPPRMVFFGVNSKIQYENFKKILNVSYEKLEKRSFLFTLSRIQDSIDNNYPVIAGPLDMYYLHYSRFYHNTHIPIHYVMIVGYDEGKREVIIYDCDREEPQKVSYEQLEKALNVNVQRIGSKNTFHVFYWPEIIPKPQAIAERSLKLQIQFMLDPPLSNLGIKGMRKLAYELPRWRKELNEEQIRASFEQLVYFMDDRFENKNFNARKYRFAEEFIKPSSEFLNNEKLLSVIPEYKKSGDRFVEIASCIKQTENYDLDFIASKFLEVAEIEERLYLNLREIMSGSIEEEPAL